MGTTFAGAALGLGAIVGATSEAKEPVMRPAATCVRTSSTLGTGTTGVSKAGFSARAALTTLFFERRGWRATTGTASSTFGLAVGAGAGTVAAALGTPAFRLSLF